MSLMIFLLLILYSLWGAFLWRVRGGAWETLLHLPPGTTKARLACAVAFALPLSPFIGWHASGVALGLMAGLVFAAWGPAMDIGRVSGSRLLDTISMTGWGLVTVAPVSLLAWGGGYIWWPILAAGASFGVIYAVAWWQKSSLPTIKRFAAGPTEWAESAVGFVVALALVAAIP